MVRDGPLHRRDPPALLGSRCAACGAHHFPRARHLPLLRGRGSRAGRAVAPGHAVGLDRGDRAAARATRARSPTASAWSSCPRAIRVITRLTESDPAALARGPADGAAHRAAAHATGTATTSSPTPSPRPAHRERDVVVVRRRPASLRPLRRRLDHRHGRRRRARRAARGRRRQGRLPGRVLRDGLRRGGHRATRC